MKRPHEVRPPLSFRAHEAITKLGADVAYRLPSGRKMAHVVLRYDLGVALLRLIQQRILKP